MTLVLAVILGMTGLVAIAADGEKKEKTTAKPRAKALEKYDKNSDGKLDKSEREAARAERRKPAEDKKPGDEPKKDN